MIKGKERVFSFWIPKRRSFELFSELFLTAARNPNLRNTIFFCKIGISFMANLPITILNPRLCWECRVKNMNKLIAWPWRSGLFNVNNSARTFSILSLSWISVSFSRHFGIHQFMFSKIVPAVPRKWRRIISTAKLIIFVFFNSETDVGGNHVVGIRVL